MKNLDNWQRQGMCVVLCSVLFMWVVYVILIEPKRHYLHGLKQEIRQLEHIIKAQYGTEYLAPETYHGVSCAWEKDARTWELTGSFSWVYDCLQQSDAQGVASLQLRKHTLGVRAIIGFDEIPA